jgi:hypothetical protein
MPVRYATIALCNIEGNALVKVNIDGTVVTSANREAVDRRLSPIVAI